MILFCARKLRDRFPPIGGERAGVSGNHRFPFQFFQAFLARRFDQVVQVFGAVAEPGQGLFVQMVVFGVAGLHISFLGLPGNRGESVKLARRSLRPAL